MGATAISAASGAVVALTKQSVESYAEYEQLIGGIDTLFNKAGMSWYDYAAKLRESGQMTVDNAAEMYEKYLELEKGSRMVQENAAKAFETAGLSANAYMEMTTSFSASLLQSLGGDTVKAAEYADMAIIDMADNANKMGTNIESIQTAYQGFAKQNYSMLDNLKLGYGGTSQEMYRLLSDAAKLDAQFAKTAKFSIDNKGHLTAGYADIVKAINIVQTEMGITGTTAEEAASTIQGSASMMKAAWENLVTGMADEEANLEELFGNVVTSAETLFENVMPIAETALLSITDLIEMAAPMIIEKIPGLAERILPSLLGAATSILNALASALPGVFDALSSTVLQISDTLTTTLKDGLLSEDSVSKLVESALNLVLALSEAILPNLPLIIESGLTLIIALAQGIAESIPELIPTIVDVVLQIVDTLTDPETLTSLVDAAIAIIFALAEALIDGDVIGTLLAKAPEIVQNLVTAITDNAGKLLTAAGDLIVKLAEGLVNKEKLEEIKTAAKDIIDSLKTGITDLWTDIKGVGSNIVAGVKQGISEAWTNMKEWLSTLFGDIITIAKEILGIASPSKEFKTIGKFLDEGLAKGIKDYADVAIGEAESLVNGVIDAAQIEDPTISITPKIETATMAGAFDGVDFNALASTSINGIAQIAQSVDYDSLVKASLAGFGTLVELFKSGEAVVNIDNSRDLRRALNV